MKTLIFVIIVALVIVAIIKFIDEMKLNSLKKEVSDYSIESESTNLLFLYADTMQHVDKDKLCKVIEFSTKRQLDKGYYFVTLLKTYEEANLLADYEETRNRYFLSNVALWLYTTQSKTLCNNSEVTPLLFFYKTNTACPDCIVQGQILDKIREKCPNVRVITLASDTDLSIIKLIMSQYNVMDAPTLVIDNKDVLEGVQNETSIMKYINCDVEKNYSE
jgi:hypothetical protein